MSSIPPSQRLATRQVAQPRQSLRQLPSGVFALLLVAVVLPVPLILLRSFILPRRFDLDAIGIGYLLDYPFILSLEDYGSYAVIANVYRTLGFSGADTVAAGLLSYSILAAAVFVALWRAGRVPRGIYALGFIAATLVLAAIFMGTFTKELMVAATVLLVLLLPRGLRGEIAAVAVMFAFGYWFRSYWMIVAAVYAVFRILILIRGFSKWMWAVVVATTALTGFAIWVGTGNPADFARLTVNEYRSVEVNTLIERFVDWPEPLGGVVNVVLTLFALVIPVPLFMLGTPYHVVSALFIVMVWALFAQALWQYRDSRPTGYVARALMLTLAFLSVQALFEPDFGSFLRHMTPIFPLVILAIAARAPDASDAAVFEMHNNSEVTTMGATMSDNVSESGDRMWNRVLSALGRLWWGIVLSAVIFAAIGFGISMLMPKKYTATTDIFVTAAPSKTGDSQLFAQSEFFQQRLASYAELVKGDVLIGRVIDELNLDYTKSEMQEMLEGEPTPQTVIFQLSATAEDPEQARQISDVAAKQLKAMVSELDVYAVQDTQQWIDPVTGAPMQNTNVSTEPFTSMTITDTAEVPSEPSSPKYVLNTVLGGIFGLLAAVIAIAVTTLLDRTVSSRSDVEDIAGVPVLGEVPVNPQLGTGRLPDYRTDITPAVEGIRALRTNLRFVDVDKPPKIIAITSSVQGEGKTTVALNLASSLAAEGHSVLLIDGDLRRPRVARSIGPAIEGSVGLSTILAGDISINDAIQNYSERSFDIIASGMIPPNPAELLASNACRALLDELAGRYDYVIVDSPPLLPVTDGSLLAASAQAAILVVRHGETTYEQIRDSKNILDTVNAHLVGTALNRVPEGSRHGYHYSAYSKDTSSSGRRAVRAKR
ncbi:polysaccharide biosynthesis tyrosine autokinase [Corynebacterium sp. TAE3-ERU12]|uniref:polysaccharide biosynthesis tyrosine autokinase n=1 Tax=Corynebacterium sp. TAE3-ERU12 TaxID=2849491 RepID=UPI001C441799|nr:polysaccharide biosynthesis tyrosine autokinase [Corynebacterium sp. TAE3-ERU12]MBV7295952.1 polysaccharide biosynthesis tyrosine autokinase [Corynebacterium sp. TAE3-ERU12]